MKVQADQLGPYLQRQKDFPRVFFISGNEPLQVMEAADTIRAAAKQAGFIEREIFHTDAQFDWNQLAGASNALSLFSEKKILDVRVTNKSPGKAGSQAIRDYLQHIPDDKVLILQTPKLDRSMANSAWVKALDKSGIMTQVWELSAPQTMSWVVKRMKMAGMHPSSDAVRLLTERVEGNLLAATQEINKLKLLHVKNEADNQATEINDEMVLASVSDSSRFNVFDLANAVMLGDTHRIQHIHHNLREEGAAIQLVLWTLTDLTRQLYDASFKLRNGLPESKVIASVPRPRQKPFQMALRRMQHAHWPELIQMNSQIDRVSKGQGETANKGMSRVWQDLLELALSLAGKPVLAKA
ncbi:MAG TPA: DNA polymerase III subunit delta [Leucothrix mucor]|nr:DNA polymerase III subunit delta [Leucothrix mucor]